MATVRKTASAVTMTVNEADNSAQERCAFPLEMAGKRCPVAVFNSPTSPNERISFSGKKGAKPIAFVRGLLAVFTEREADLVRQANPGGSTYIEANPRLADEPLVCTACFPKTRWYSQEAYQRHTTFAHIN